MPRIDSLLATTEPAGGTTPIEIAMVIFITVFVLIVLWVMFARPGKYRKAAQIPLDDQTVMTPRNTDQNEGADNG